MDRHEILAATTPLAIDAVTEAFACTYPVVFAHSVDHANRLIYKGNLKLIAVSLVFDESRPFELLPAAKSTATPIILVRFGISLLRQHAIDCAFQAAPLLGFDGVFDLPARSAAVGRSAAMAELRSTIMSVAL